jgi:hypothetical protein
MAVVLDYYSLPYESELLDISSTSSSPEKKAEVCNSSSYDNLIQLLKFGNSLRRFPPVGSSPFS